MKLNYLTPLVCLLILTGVGLGQDTKNEVGLLLGGIATGTRTVLFPTRSDADPGSGLTYEATYARRTVGGKVGVLYAEFVFTATPLVEIKSSNLTLPRDYASLYLTPGVKVKFLPGARLAPYLAIGGGYARYTGSQFLTSNQPNLGKRAINTGAFDYGGGVDVRLFRHLGLRGEVRDFLTGNPNFNAPLASNRQHNVLDSGGIVIHF